MDLTDLSRHNQKSISAAGPRYTPGLDPSAPNIRIDHLVEAVDALTLTEGFRHRLRDLHDQLEEVHRRTRYSLGRTFARRSITPQEVIDDLERLASLVRPHAIRERTSLLRRRCRLVVDALRAELGRIDDAQDELRQKSGDKPKERSRELDNRRYQLNQLQSALLEVQAFLEGAGIIATDRKALFIVGTWGTGKTHLMCDLARHNVDGTVPTLLFLASTIDSGANVLDALAASSGLATNGERLLNDLNSLGAASGRRALLLVDGVNEGDHEMWRRTLGPLARAVSRYKHLGLVVTCRRPYEQQLLAASASERFEQIEHWGFADLEFDVQLEFFRHYELEAPEVPLITSEFSNPLFLKLFCKAIQDLSAGTQRRKFSEIAAGQKTMNHIFEYFAKRVGKSVESDFSLSGRAPCWELLKAFAELTVQSSSEWLPLDDALDLVASRFNFTRTRAEALIDRMVAEGLLIRQMHWAEAGTTEAVHFPFQRFGDHLVARYLLQTALDAASEESVRRSFYVNRPLGRVFRLDRWGRDFSDPGLAEALMVEFPERVKRTSVGSTELAWYLPKARRYASPLADPFLDGLYWRSASSFTEATDHLVSFLLGLEDPHLRHRTLDTLVGLATRPGHPYSAERLKTYLYGQSMRDRDLAWSEYIRLSEEDGPFHRVIAWADKSETIRRGEDTVENDIRLLSLGLTTTVRPLRDRITRALVRLGHRSPVSLFRVTVESLECNDPYVPERMLAASYGLAMRLWADPRGNSLREALPEFARKIVRLIFLTAAPHSTTHTLMVDYARGLIELANKVKPRSIATQHLHHVHSPAVGARSQFVAPEEIRDQDVEVDSRALHMDFENYTIGRLIPHRRNYDNQHSDYQAVRKQILRRMQDLGYSAALFDELDNTIAQYSFRSNEQGKTDRYGKKYSWIAFFEMCGLRSALCLLDDWRDEQRSSDSDIDPSFPSEALEWKPDLPDYFTGTPRGKIQWLRSGPNPEYGDLLRVDEIDGHSGPWVLIDGFIDQEGSAHRQVFTFLRAILAPEASVPRIREFVEARDYLGNHAIPSSGEDYYTFAGEIPWSTRFADGRRLASGRARRHLEAMIQDFRHGSWRSSLIVEVPTHHWVWESHHSVLNQVSGVMFPAPALCEELDLVNHCDSFDLFDSTGARASVYREWPAERDAYHGSYLLYLREDLLLEYLRSTDQTLIWIPWGERNHRPSGVSFERPSAAHSAALQEHANIHRRILTYQDALSS